MNVCFLSEMFSLTPDATQQRSGVIGNMISFYCNKLLIYFMRANTSGPRSKISKTTRATLNE